MITFQAQVRIEQPREKVFAVVADPRSYPRWNSAVQSVRPVQGSTARYRMERDLPGGRADNLLEVVSSTPPSDVTVRATDGPTPFLYRYDLTESGGGTTLTLDAEVELGGHRCLARPACQPHGQTRRGRELRHAEGAARAVATRHRLRFAPPELPALKRAGIVKPFRPWHDLRHTALTHEAAAGNPAVYVQMKAGHAQGTITERYIHAAQVLFPGAARAEERMFGAAGHL